MSKFEAKRQADELENAVLEESEDNVKPPLPKTPPPPKATEASPPLPKTPPPQKPMEASPLLPKTSPPQKSLETTPSLPKTPPPSLKLARENSVLTDESSTPISDLADIVTAFPAIVKDEEELDSSIEAVRPNTLDISSDSDLSIERSYNLVTGLVMLRRGDQQKEISKSQVPLEGLKYEEKQYDENHNENVPYENKEEPHTPPSSPTQARHFILNEDHLKSYEEQEQNLLLSNETYSSGGHLLHRDLSSFDTETCKSLDSSFEEEITELQGKKLVKTLLQNFSNTNAQATKERPSQHKIEKPITTTNLRKATPIPVEQPVAVKSKDEIKTETTVTELPKIEVVNSNSKVEDEDLMLPNVKELKQLFDNSVSIFLWIWYIFQY